MDMSELLEEYQNINRLWHFEGDSGLGKFGEILKALGYREHGFKYGSVIEVFLSDNPGAIEAILNWIGEQNAPEWIEGIESELPNDEDELDCEQSEQ